MPYFSARLDFPSSPLSAPGSPRMVCFWILYMFLLLLPFISICYSLLRFRLNNYPLKSFPINSRVINKLTVKKDSWLYYVDLVQMHCSRKYQQYRQKIIRFIIKSSIRDTVKACLWKIEKNQNCKKYLNLLVQLALWPSLLIKRRVDHSIFP